jgi:uncharacterized protein (TIGR03382 family)
MDAHVPETGSTQDSSLAADGASIADSALASDGDPPPDADPAGDGEVADSAPVESDGAAVIDAAGLPEAGPLPEAGAAVDSGTMKAGAGSCSPIMTSPSSTACVDKVLTDNQIAIGAATSTIVTTSDDGGSSDAGDAAPTTTTIIGTGGISAIPSGYLSGQTASSTTSLILTGLTNHIVYHVVVASIDGSDNVGPTSALKCATPAPVQDFWSTYKGDGGSASGGCALEGGSSSQQGSLFGLGMFAAAVAWLRRRRR